MSETVELSNDDIELLRDAVMVAGRRAIKSRKKAARRSVSRVEILVPRRPPRAGRRWRPHQPQPLAESSPRRL
jgi:hypothetical protein